MFDLKPLHPESIPSALEKAKHYRLLNEPIQAESICLDILEVSPQHREATVTLILALTDQFERRLTQRFKRATALLDRLQDEYDKTYYRGIMCERRALVHLRQHTPTSGHVTYEWLRQAMDLYERADTLSPAENDDARLRWNSCARLINRSPELKPEEKRTYQPYGD
jgi:hypothetical protein